MRLILNILWLILGGGLVAGLLWFLGAVIMAVTIVGLPWARACVTIGVFNLWPFGREAIKRSEVTGREDIAPARWAPSATSSGSCSPAFGWRLATSWRRSASR